MSHKRNPPPSVRHDLCVVSPVWGSASQDEKESIATIQMALDNGINFLNTGDFYANGHNKLLVGKAIKGRRDDGRADRGTEKKKNGKPSSIYLDLGFESLSHFSHSFKKMFGKAPTEWV